MRLKLERFFSTSRDTLGLLFLNDRFVCFSLEDEYREVKLPEETRIPPGTYYVILSHSPKFSPRYGHEMLTLQKVPNFDRILIHPGNTERDTAGCILIGNSVRMALDEPCSLYESRMAYERLYAQISPAAAMNQLTIEIIDRDR